MTNNQLKIIFYGLLVVVVCFVAFLFFQDQSEKNNSAQAPIDKQIEKNKLSSTTEAKIEKIEAETAQKINAIEQKGTTEYGGVTKETATQMEQAVNEEIQKKLGSGLVSTSTTAKSRQEADRIENEMNKYILQKLKK